MKTHYLATLACAAWAAFSAVPVAQAAGTDGDIRSIQAVPFAEYGTEGNITSPHTIGETFYVRVRLLNDEWAQAMAEPPVTHPWVIERNARELPSDWKDVIYRPALRLAIGAKKVDAQFSWTGPNGELSGINLENDFYTDLYFAYTVKEGELGQPVRFVNAKDQIVESVSGAGNPGFYFVNVNTTGRTGGYWDLTNDRGNKANFWFGPSSPDPDPADMGRKYPGSDEGDFEHMVPDRVYPGIFVKTVDFVGQDGDVAEGVWREVSAESDELVGKTMSVEGQGPATVYVWTEDETVAVPMGEVDTSVTDRTVVKVTLNTDGDPVNFKVRGGTAAVGATTKIYLCSQKNPAKNALGQIIEGSTLVRTIRMAPSADPYVSISRASDDERSGIKAEATTDYQNGVQMHVTFSKPFTEDVAVRIAMKVGETEFNPTAGKYIAILNKDGDPTVDTSVDTVTIKAGEKEALFTVYPLGSTDDLKTKGITFTPVLTVGSPAAAFFTGGVREAVVTVTDQKPEATLFAPTSAMQGEEIDIDILAKDNWRDLQPTLNTAGYRVVVKINNEDVFDKNGIAFTEDENQTVSVKVPVAAEGAVTCSVRIWDATHTRTSDYSEQTFTLNVTRKPEFTATPYFFATPAEDSERIFPGEFNEGDTPIVRVVLSQLPTSDVYAFLVPTDEMTKKIVDTTAYTQGLLISRDNANPTNSLATTLNLLDGDALLTHLTRARLKVVLKDKPDFDDPTATEISTYECKALQFGVANVNPAIGKVWKGTAANGARIYDGDEYKGRLPSGSPVTFTALVADPGRADLEDVSRPIRVRWVYTDGPEGDNPEQTPIVTEVKANGYTSCPITFYESGAKQTVSLYAQDRDMFAGDEDEFGELLFSFTVKVGEQPQVILGYPTGNTTGYYDENAAKNKNQVNVKLSEYPASTDHGATDPAVGTTARPLKVKLTVDDSYHTDFGELKLIDPKTGEAKKEVIVEFTRPEDNKDGKTVYFDIDSQNGGDDNPTMFMISAEVINEEHNQYETPWKDYFFNSEKAIYMQNIVPKLSVSPGDQHAFGVTNTWTAGEIVSLKWKMDDIRADLTSGNAMITWTLGDTLGRMMVMVDPTKVTGTVSRASVTDTYTFVVPDAPLTEVTLTANDGDGGEASYTFWIKVTPTKKISINPYGPALSTETKYDAFGGVGRGHIYVENSTGQYVVRQFKQVWNYAEAQKQAHVYAVGYPAVATDAYDNGAIDPGFIGAALTPNGSKWVSGSYYNYGRSELDNFFYCWALIDDEAGVTLFPPNPSKSTTEMADKYFLLDNEKTDDDAAATYGTVQIEAIFSQEFLKSDNMGDINADAIPDVYVKRYPGLGVIGEDGNIAGSDLANISKGNVDEDYFPAHLTSPFAALIPGLEDTWVTGGRAFTTRMEIRGFGDHFNNGPELARVRGVKPDIRYTDPDEDENSTLTKLEYTAFVHYCAREGLDATLESSWAKWSPERPTDPSDPDTDGDGITDGYEYFFWYRAHVGYYDEDGNYQRLTGRRYNPADPCNPIEITPEEIEAMYDPLTANEDIGEVDTDNDGIPDLVELEIGTNPLDYDTDGDWLPDGYEVSITGTDPLLPHSEDVDAAIDRAANPDGDHFAKCSIKTLGLTFEIVDEDGNVTTNTYYVSSSPTITVSEETGATNLMATIDLIDTWDYTPNGEQAYRRIAVRADDDDAAKMLDWKIIAVSEDNVDVSYLHYQVNGLKGFNPTTGWNKTPCLKGHRTDTATFTHYDEFMTMAFYHQMGGLPLARITPTPTRNMILIWTEFSTNPLDADTDHDGMPDGWELYIQTPGALNGSGPDSPFSPLSDFAEIKGTRAADNDPFMQGDGLEFDDEFMGIESCAVYADCPTIVNKRPRWQNKLWPTDPWNGDTDGDGILDGQEETWIWGDGDRGDDFDILTNVVDGGGLNPLSWDTDGDGLPDPWEIQFQATTSDGGEESDQVTDTSHSVTNADGSVSNVTSSVTNRVISVAHANLDGMNPTKADDALDYDNDGLDNWQEYMVGAMRCWRYDDTTSPWTVHKVTADDVKMHIEDGEWWWNVLVNYWPDLTGPRDFVDHYRPGLRNEIVDPGIYFSGCRNEWDLTAYGFMYMFFDGIDHDLSMDLRANQNRWTAQCQAFGPGAFASFELSQGGQPICPKQYICCDPRMADTDLDGMDDYYELYHGLNPLLGAAAGGAQGGGPRDIVYIAYGGGQDFNPWSAKANYWLDNDQPVNGTLSALVNLKDPEKSRMDFVQYPWLNGLADADPDGDNIRNQQEAILTSVQAAPTYQHIDPSPLWMTDSTFTESLTYRFYNLNTPPWASSVGSFEHPTGYFEYEGVIYHFNDFPWLHWDPMTSICEINWTVNRHACVDSISSYEENEGYDTDHDYLSDFEESQGKTKSASNPQDSDDPIRHQAMWFDGKDSFLQTPLELEWIGPVNQAQAEPRQNYLYYTVEAWVKADADILDKEGLYTILERVMLTGEANAADERFVRRNFYLGIRNGRWYTKFDSTGTDESQPVEVSEGPVATTAWTHLAASYGPENGDQTDAKQPMALKFFVNGVLVKSVRTALMPENGSSAITVTAAGQFANAVDWPTVNQKRVISTLVGASAITDRGINFNDAWDKRSQEEYKDFPPYYLAPKTNYGDYSNFFKGYIDEVRLWDGVRTPEAIKADVDNKVRYTRDMALANREEVFTAWDLGARRTPDLSEISLPAQLMAHWSFDHIPGAVTANEVLTSPAGFTTDPGVLDAKAIWSRPANWGSPWWTTSLTRSKIYTDDAWIPWINNTVGHLPLFDGSTYDSAYWTTDYAGMTSANSLRYEKFRFPLTAEPASRVHQHLFDGKGNEESPFNFVLHWLRVKDNQDLKNRYVFASRNRLIEGYDLLPMGGAFAKRISMLEGGMWDDGTAADAWAQTGVDGDNNGLPDWWEQYARKNYAENLKPWDKFDWFTAVTYNGVVMPAWQAYLRDIANGILSDGKYHYEYADTRDIDKDGLPDWWEDINGINTNTEKDGYADDDGDGLSNADEYLISEVFRYAAIDPKNPRTNGTCLDYFLKVGDLYLGEIFTDHDQMDYSWESMFDPNYANAFVFDANLDNDGDGWSNYAEFRAGTDPSKKISDVIQGKSYPQYPMPIIDANVIYNGSDVCHGDLVFKAWNEKFDYDMVKAPDAIWTVTSPFGGNKVQQNQNNDNDALAASVVSRERYLGQKPNGKRTYHLGAGSISEGSLQFMFLDKEFADVLVDEQGNVTNSVPGVAKDAIWYMTVRDFGGKLIVSSGASGTSDAVCGSVDYKTGEVTIDFSHRLLNGKTVTQGAAKADEDEDKNNGENKEEKAPTYQQINFSGSHVLMQWETQSAVEEPLGHHVLFEPDSVTLSPNQHGWIREGLNTFICFEDLDGNGEYTPGELFGVVRNVDVGWSGAKFDVELTEVHPIFGRVAMDTANDRLVWYGIDSGNVTNMMYGSANSSSTSSAATETPVDSTLSGGRYQHVRVDRYAVNGVTIGTSTSQVYVVDRILVDKWLNLGMRPFICEADFLEPEVFDIDWGTFSEIESAKSVKARFGGEVLSVSYRVVVDNADFVNPAVSNRVLDVAFTRSFDGKGARTIAQGLKGMLVYGAHPTFRWNMNGHNSYTAFKLQIRSGEAVVYESPMTRVPKMDAEGNYVWEAPFSVGDQTPQGTILSRTGNYTWTVSMYNAKFQEDAYATPVPFVTAVNMQQPLDDHEYGSINVTVKYTGPALVIANAGNMGSTAGKVRVQAFESPDFAGVPASQTVVMDRNSLSDVEDMSFNATLTGLKAGHYYLRAYIDTDGDFEKDEWESWGAVKTAVDVPALVGAVVPRAEIYIEDADTDQDWLPDAYEYAAFGSLEAHNARVDPKGEIILKSEVYDSAMNTSPHVSKFLTGSSLTFFSNIETAKLLLGLGSDTATDTIQSIRDALAKKLVADSLKITALTVDAPNKRVMLSVNGDLEDSASAMILAPVYKMPTTTLTVRVLRKETLATDKWETVNDYPVVVSSSLNTTLVVPIEEDLTSGFYKVEVVK